MGFIVVVLVFFLSIDCSVVREILLVVIVKGDERIFCMFL